MWGQSFQLKYKSFKMKVLVKHLFITFKTYAFCLDDTQFPLFLFHFLMIYSSHTAVPYFKSVQLVVLTIF